LNWTFSSIGVIAPLQRKCTCAGQQKCEECEKDGLIQRKLAGSSQGAVVPPIVQEVLRSPGRPLDTADRDFFELRFGHDFGQVRVHADNRSAESAQAIKARAFTAGRHVVFGENEYRPQTSSGRKLLAHELARVIQQRETTAVVRRKPLNDQAEPDQELWDEAVIASETGDMQQCVPLLNQLSPKRLQEFLKMFGGGPERYSLTYTVAVAKLGKESQVAKATLYTHLEFNYNKELGQGHYRYAAEFLNGFSKKDIDVRLSKLKTPQLQALHDGAAEHGGIGGAGSVPAIESARILSERAAKGDAGAVPVAKGPTSVADAKKQCEAGEVKEGKIFALRMPQGLWRIHAAPISAREEGDEIVVKQPNNDVYADPMFRRESRTLPLSTFTSGLHLRPDEIVRVRLYDDNNRVICVTGEELLRLSAATDAAIGFGMARTAVDAATVFVPGVGAGLSKGANLAIGAGVVVANQGLEAGRQATMVQYGLQDHIDWLGLGFDTLFQLATLRFAGPLSEAATGKLLGTAASEFGKPAIHLAVEMVLSGSTFAVQTMARGLFDRFRNGKSDMTVEQFIWHMAGEFVTGAIFHLVMHNLEHESSRKTGSAAVSDEPGVAGSGPPAPKAAAALVPDTPAPKAAATPVPDTPATKAAAAAGTPVPDTPAPKAAAAAATSVPDTPAPKAAESGRTPRDAKSAEPSKQPADVPRDDAPAVGDKKLKDSEQKKEQSDKEVPVKEADKGQKSQDLLDEEEGATSAARALEQRTAELQRLRAEIAPEIAQAKRKLGSKKGELGRLWGEMRKHRGGKAEALRKHEVAKKEYQAATRERYQLEDRLQRLEREDRRLQAAIKKLNEPLPTDPLLAGPQFERQNLDYTGMQKNTEKYKTSFPDPDAPDGMRIPDHMPMPDGKGGWANAPNLAQADFVGDSKLMGKIKPTPQVKGFIELASKTRNRRFVVFTPPEATFSDAVKKFAAEYDVSLHTMTRPIKK
jgi:hypothetical protein